MQILNEKLYLFIYLFIQCIDTDKWGLKVPSGFESTKNTVTLSDDPC